MKLVHIPLDWSNLEPFVMYRVYQGMRAWLQERAIDHKFEFRDSSVYYPSAVIMDEESAISFRLIF